MELNVVPHKALKRLYYNFLAICLIITSGSFLLYKLKFTIFPVYLWALGLKNVFFYIIIGAALVVLYYSIYRKRRISEQTVFADKLTAFEKYYIRRLWWHVLSCLTTAVFLQLTWHILFFYFALFDLLSLVNVYPSRSFLKKELDEDDLIFN